MGPMKKAFEVGANLAIILVCCLLAWKVFSRNSKPSSLGDSSTQLQGEVIPPFPGHSWISHRKTLVLAIRRGCHFCEASLPFYRKLISLENADKLRAHVIAILPDNRESGSAFLYHEGIQVDGIFDQPLGNLKISGTPTLLLVDSNGRVAQAWVGQLTAEGESDVIAAAER